MTIPVSAVLPRRGLLAGAAGLVGLAALGRPLPALAQVRASRAELKAGVERLDPALDAVVDARSEVAVLATGYAWAEGPAWIEAGRYLLYSDPPANTMYRLRPGHAPEVFLRPSGLAGTIPAEIREPGANGIALDGEGRLVMADSGTRAIVRLDLETRTREILVDRYQGRRLNSPNDVTVSRSGAIYFSDPPYGLSGGDESPLRELDANGLYRLDRDGTLVRLDIHHRPNGVALSPDERTLYLALSDEARPELLAYPLDAGGMPAGPAHVLHDMRTYLAEGRPGLPDGLDIAPDGTIFATGPGGVHVLSPSGRLLGIVATGKAVANCAIGEGGKALYMTSHDGLARVALKGPAR